MKINALHFVSFFGTSLGIAIILVIVGALGTAKAQNILPNFNGLFTPTSADRFFEEGRRNLEREAHILAHPELYSGEDLIQLNTIDIKLIEETEETNPSSNFSQENPQEELD
ncbi:MAG: hypothetical protein QNJ55_36455 [Xenococcus sp. MO_188.B8]|nr:hypothetical protein [Xenococcus sp. MO_188.B8]